MILQILPNLSDATMGGYPLVEFESGDALKDALHLPGDAGHAVQLPPHVDGALVWLPYALNLPPRSRHVRP